MSDNRVIHAAFGGRAMHPSLGDRSVIAASPGVDNSYTRHPAWASFVNDHAASAGDHNEKEASIVPFISRQLPEERPKFVRRFIVSRDDGDTGTPGPASVWSTVRIVVGVGGAALVGAALLMMGNWGVVALGLIAAGFAFMLFGVGSDEDDEDTNPLADGPDVDIAARFESHQVSQPPAAWVSAAGAGTKDLWPDETLGGDADSVDLTSDVPTPEDMRD